MRWVLMIVTLASCLARAEEAPSAWRLGGGVGCGVEYINEVNPAFGEYHVRPRLFAFARKNRLGAFVEVDRQPTVTTRTGGLTIESGGYIAGVWARYDGHRFGDADIFATLGAGAHFDAVRTSFNDVNDNQHGTRRFLGGGIGASRGFLSRGLAEVEVRVLGHEAARRLGWASAFRVGVVF